MNIEIVVMLVDSSAWGIKWKNAPASKVPAENAIKYGRIVSRVSFLVKKESAPTNAIKPLRSVAASIQGSYIAASLDIY